MAAGARGRPWKKGESGNPAGRKPGTGAIGKLRSAIGEHVPSIIEKQVQLALEGDTAAAKLLLERVVPALKPVELPTLLPALAEGSSLSEQGRAALQAMAAGELAPGQACALLGALAGLAKLIEADDLARRVEALEAAG